MHENVKEVYENVEEVYEDDDEVYDLDEYYPPKQKYKKKKKVYEDEEEVYDLDDYYPPKKKYKKKKKVPKEKPEPPLVKVTYNCQFCDAKLGDLHLIHDFSKYSSHFVKFCIFDQTTYSITLVIAIAFAIFSVRVI